MFRKRDSKASRLQVVPTDETDWPQENLKAGEPVANDQATIRRAGT